MLEHPHLWLGPWSCDGRPPRPDAPTDPPAWAILDPATRTFLGLARRRLTTATVWFGCLSRPALEVYETEDESLLFTLTRSWGLGTGWLVADADGHRIGSLRGKVARDRFGRRLAVLETGNDSVQGRWLATDGRELGTFAPANDGILAAFAGTGDDNPFLKMLLLASLLRTI